MKISAMLENKKCISQTCSYTRITEGDRLNGFTRESFFLYVCVWKSMLHKRPTSSSKSFLRKSFPRKVRQNPELMYAHA